MSDNNISVLTQSIDSKYLIDTFVDTSWQIIVIILIILLYKPLRELISSLANNLGKAKEIVISGISWKTIDLENAVADLEILKAVLLTAHADNDINLKEIDIIIHKVRNMPSYINHISIQNKERILIESINH
jgi:3-dehydroquinate synthase class II